ncbi:RNA polymerase sigma factor [Reichenbachiella ulvae]|uniref:Sigma-70 family RNA polymerase sigma factor n=1 Tax=Reichenbachiella ulvae TaxID=2980104 RepID=A0ABT3CW83_9BACT|nr:sigma-70 family RNA polymerase sigma factor [Reichenbachiella ulvae]MCV9387948.1 sigma-70 family RNA polymerase sigma factor [Reichenbachiella ulvae]
MNHSEADIIQRAKADVKHFEPLYNKYYESIFRFIYRRTDEEQATADITSRVFMNAMKALPKYEIREVGFGAWLYRIAANETNKYFRETKKQMHLSLEDEKVSLVMTCDQLEDPEEKLSVLMQLVDELEDDEIQILELKFFENKNFKEIAFILDKKESGIKMRLYRALDKLKEKFDSIRKA